VQEGLQALLIEGQALLDEGFPGFAHHEDGYAEHAGNSLLMRAASNRSSWAIKSIRSIQSLFIMRLSKDFILTLIISMP
jgi:hypothetical protein